MFAGGNGERLARGLELMEEDIATTLVIPNGRDPEWDDANELCDGRSRFDVICIEPDPDTTRGEARDVAELAEDRRFDSLILVTSSYHATRAGTLLDRCFDGDVGVAPAPPREGLVRTWLLAVREWVALADLVLVEREC